ncbi:hypothetical protein EW145_g5538 [Phellinidium pouzarii]|uniref:Defective in cullin neddylation protein n=1 Tax=Phellinidium pouzarii TaxID=167371 RepID=A0A4S4L1H5_9AGAM|nr:hypothetical protein EW145_g5538 [Phellinidium pouzarii]
MTLDDPRVKFCHDRPVLAPNLLSLIFSNPTSLCLASLVAFLFYLLCFNCRLKVGNIGGSVCEGPDKMSKSSKSKSAADRQLEANITQFCSVTGSSLKDARKFLEKYKRLDAAIDSYYNNPNQFGGASSKKTEADRIARLGALFEKYKDPHEDEITIDGTIKLCEDLGVNPENVVLLAVAYELKSPSMGTWTRKGWVDGWRSLGQDTIEGMTTTLAQLSTKLASDPQYFQQVYSYTFSFALAEGQRSLRIEDAQGFWNLLIPFGIAGGALRHATSEEDGDDVMDGDEEGWRDEHTEWWFEFLKEKGGRGISRDTWMMFLEFVRSIDSNFEKYDETSSWPSTIDNFVEWVREKIATGN